METEKVYCKGCARKFRGGYSGCTVFCKIQTGTKPTNEAPSVPQYVVDEPEDKNKNNDCKDWTPSRLHRLRLWIIRKVEA